MRYLGGPSSAAPGAADTSIPAGAAVSTPVPKHPTTLALALATAADCVHRHV